MCSDCLVLRDDPSAFKVLDVCKYFQNLKNIFELILPSAHFFKSTSTKRADAISIQIYSIKSGNIYIYSRPQKPMGHPSTLSNQST